MMKTELKNILLKDCSGYFKQLKRCQPGNILLRGSFQQIDSFKKFKHDLSYRKPLHMPEDIHNFINKELEGRFGWKIRNGAFCYGFNIRSHEIPTDLGYGAFFLFFPIGNFKIVYSPSVFDMFGHVNMSTENINSILPNIEFRDSTICSAIESGDRKYQNVSNEISVCTNSYYLVNYSYKDMVLDLIWN